MAVVMDSAHNLDDTTAEYNVVSNKRLKSHFVEEISRDDVPEVVGTVS